VDRRILEVVVQASGLNKLNSGLASTSKSFRAFGQEAANSVKGVDFVSVGTQIENTGRKLKVLSVASAGAIGATVRVASQYEREFSKIQGLVGLSANEVDRLKDSTLSLAGATARAPQELATAMFTIQSAGLRGQQGMNALDIAARSAAAGMGTTQANARALTGALNAYQSTGLTAARAGDILAATARAGNFELAGLAGALGRVLPVASTLGVGLDQVGGAIALLTRSGLSAAESITQIRAVLNSLLAPSEATQKQLRAVGLSMEDLRSTLTNDGIVGALNQLFEASGRNEQVFARMIGSQEAVGAAFKLTSASASELQDTFGQVANSAGVLNEAFDAAASTESFKMEQALVSLRVAAIEIGNVFLPVAAKIAGGVAAMTREFGELPQPLQTVLAGMLAVSAASSPFLTVFGRIIKVGGQVGPSLLKAGAGLSKLAAETTTATAGITRVGNISANALGPVGLFGKTAQGTVVPLGKMGASASTSAAGVSKLGVASAGAGGAVAALAGLIIGTAIGAYIGWAKAAEETQRRVTSFDEALARVPGTAQYAVAELTKVQETLSRLDDQADETTEGLSGVESAISQALAGSLTEEAIRNGNLLGLTFDDLAQSVPDAQKSLLDFRGVAAQVANDYQTAGAAGAEWAAIIRDQMVVENEGLVDTLLKGVEAGVISRQEAARLAEEWTNSADALRRSNEEQDAAAKSLVELGEAQGKYSDVLLQTIKDQNTALDGSIDWVGVNEDLLRIFGTLSIEARKYAGAVDGVVDSLDGLDGVGEYFGDIIEGGRESAEEIEQLAAELDDLDGRDIDVGIDADTDSVERALEILTDMTTEDWEVAVRADTDRIDDDLATTALSLAKFTDEEIVAVLAADDELFNAQLAVALQNVGVFSTDHLATLILDASQPQRVLEVITRTLGQLAGINIQSKLTAPIAETRAFDAAGRNAVATINSLNFGFDRLAGVARAGAGELGKIGTAARSAGGGAKSAGKAAKEAAEEIEELTDVVIRNEAQWDTWLATLDATQREVAETALEEAKLRLSITESESALKSAAGQQKVYATALDLTKDKLGDIADEAVKAADGTEAAEDAAEAYEDALDDLVDTTEDYLDAASEAAAENQDLASSYDRVRDAIDDAKGALEGYAGVQKDSLEAAIDYEEAVDKLRKSLSEAQPEEAEGDEPAVAGGISGGTLDLGQNSGRDVAEALIEAAENAQAYALSLIEAGNSAEVARDRHAGMVEEILRAAESAGLSREAVNGLVGEMLTIPDAVLIQAEVDAGAALDELAELKGEIDSFDGTTAEAKAVFDTIQARAELVEVIQEAEGFDGTEVLATLAADSNPFDATLTNAILQVAGFSETEATALLEADDANLRSTLIAALIELDVIDKKEARALLVANKGEFDVTMAQVRARLDEVDGLLIQSIIDADSTGVERGVAEALIIAQGFTLGEYKAELTADGSPLQAEVNRQILTLAGFSERKATKFIEADTAALDDAILAANIALGILDAEEVFVDINADDTEFEGKASRVERFFEEMTGRDVTVSVNADGNTEVLVTAKEDVEDLDGKDAKASVTVTRKDKNDLRRFARRLAEIGETDAEAKVRAVIRGKADLASLVTALDNVPVETTAIIQARVDGTADLSGLKNTIDEIATVHTLEVSSNIFDVTNDATRLAEVAEAATIGRIMNIDSNMPAVQAQAEALSDSADDATAERRLVMTTNAAQATGKVQGFGRAADTAVKPRTAVINVVVNDGGVSARLDGIARNRSSTVTVNTVENVQRRVSETTSFSSSKSNYRGFEHGGFQEASPSRAFIAAARSPIRVMNEGVANRTGEAFIPLVPTRRSIDIWMETGRRLGQIEAFEAGGFSSGTVGRPFAAGGGGRGGDMNVGFDIGVSVTAGAPLDQVVAVVDQRVDIMKRDVDRDLRALMP